MYTTNLDELIYNCHTNNKVDKLIILSGWIGINPIYNIAKNNIHTTIIYGCFLRGKPSLIEHKKYCDITKSSSVDIRYLNFYNHSKIYAWYSCGRIKKVLSGSANFSMNGLKDNQETLYDIEEINHNETDLLLNHCLENSISCIDYNYEIIEKKQKKIKNTNELIWPDQILDLDKPTVNIFLGGQKGKINESSAINWGQPNPKKDPNKKHKRKLSAAYFRVSKYLIKEIPQFLPNDGINIYGGKGHNSKDHHRKYPDAECIFDDGKIMNFSFEGGKGELNKFTSYQGKNYGEKRPKIHILGEYLRHRIGVEKDQKVTKEDLIRYGKDYITFVKEGENYTADFSVKNKNDFIVLKP